MGNKMLSNEYLKTTFRLGSYDCLENIYTNCFTEDLSDIVFLTDDHSFSYFFLGFAPVQNFEFLDIIRHGYFHRVSKSIHFFVRNPGKYGTWVYFAWKKFCKNDNVKVNIYGCDCSDLYLSNEYETDQTLFYKEYIKLLLDKLI
jgi:hypothetical protein